jgi:lysophospholipase L1-like esterase
MFPFQLGVPPVAAPATRLLVIEGDSIPASLSAPRAFANLYRDAHSDLAFYNFAVAGDHISNVDARSGWSDKMPTTNPTFTRWIYAPFCGGNGFLTVSNPGLAAYIQTYLDMLQGRRNAGLKAIAFTLLPRTTADFNAFRAVFNTTVRAGTQYYDALCDFAADATMGPDSVCPDSGTFDPVWYSDGTHPTQAGHALLVPTFATAVSSIA